MHLAPVRVGLCTLLVVADVALWLCQNNQALIAHDWPGFGHHFSDLVLADVVNCRGRDTAPSETAASINKTPIVNKAACVSGILIAFLSFS